MWPSDSRNAVRHGPRNEPWVYLTFDDGPDPVQTPRVLDILASFPVHATFFVLGEACERDPECVARLAEAGHQLGVHAYSHRHPWRLGSQEAQAEVQRGFEAIRAATGRAPRVFRPPFGRLRPAMARTARELGLTTIMWSRSAVDWGPWGTTGGIARRLARTRPGDIVLMHDAERQKNRTDALLQALPGYIEGCLARGLRFALVDRLIQG